LVGSAASATGWGRREVGHGTKDPDGRAGGDAAGGGDGGLDGLPAGPDAPLYFQSSDGVPGNPEAGDLFAAALGA
jgi:hypothetical protein